MNPTPGKKTVSFRPWQSRNVFDDDGIDIPQLASSDSSTDGNACNGLEQDSCVSIFECMRCADYRHCVEDHAQKISGQITLMLQDVMRQSDLKSSCCSNAGLVRSDEASCVTSDSDQDSVQIACVDVEGVNVSFLDDIETIEIDKLDARPSSSVRTRKTTLSYAKDKEGWATLRESVKRRETQPVEKSKSSLSSGRLTKVNNVFPSVPSTSTQIAQALASQSYDVVKLYSDTGCCQYIARSPRFETITLMVIFINTCWLAVDIDFNNPIDANDADVVFRLADNLFCSFFTLEVLIRFGAFEHKVSAFKDFTFVFDLSVSGMMVIETWIFPLIINCVSKRFRGIFAQTVIVKTFRLTRLTRLVRLVNVFPELRVLCKSMAIALRSVFFSCVMIVIITYIVALLFTQLLNGTPVGEQRFANVLQSGWSLLEVSIFPSAAIIIYELAHVDVVCVIVFVLFFFLVTITTLNMLIGILVEGMCTIAKTEKEQSIVEYVVANVGELLASIGIDAATISADDFERLMVEPDAVQCLMRVGVDIAGLLDDAEVFFDTDRCFTIQELITFIIRARGENPPTVQDILDMRRFITKLGEEIKWQQNTMLYEVSRLNDAASSQHKAAHRPEKLTGEAVLGHQTGRAVSRATSSAVSKATPLTRRGASHGKIKRSNCATNGLAGTQGLAGTKLSL